MAREQDAQRDWPAERRRARSNEEDQGFTTKFDTRSKFDAELEGPWPQLLISIARWPGAGYGGKGRRSWSQTARRSGYRGAAARIGSATDIRSHLSRPSLSRKLLAR